MSYNATGVEQIPYRTFTEDAYLNYSMYVILDRALPHIGDGLKPVQRRIIYAMSELGLSSTSKPKKSARTIGDVLGKYHPHGDTACYEAMVLMAQPFSYRYPLVDGQGNWGSPDDPKSFAAMRYTESKLSKFSEVLLTELGQGTVEWGPNFDGTLKEPITLPARLPHILINGITGIAVGMATDIPPHNVTELASACIALLDNPNLELDDIMSYIQGPDYPTAAEIITSHNEIKKIYTTGRGSIKTRASYAVIDDEIVISALPHQVGAGDVAKQIADQMQSKKLTLVADIRDESDQEFPVRLIIVPRSNRVDYEQLMAHLFATTDLEKSYRVNLNVIGLDGKPQVKSLLTILNEWLTYRVATVTRRISFRLNQILTRLHILEAQLIAFLNIDEVIKIIRDKNIVDKKQEFINRYNITEIQAKEILNIRLGNLDHLQEITIIAEQAKLNDEKILLDGLLASDRKLKTLIKKELNSDIKSFGDKRLSPLIERSESKALSTQELTPIESVTVVLSESGWIRSAKGHDIDPLSLSFKSGDNFLTAAQGRSNQSLLCLDSSGRAFATDVFSLPSARGQGKPITTLFNLPQGENIAHILLDNEDSIYLIASDAGYGFICSYSDMISRNKNGKALVSLPQNAKVLAPRKITDLENSSILAITNEGRMLLFKVSSLPKLSKGKGNKIINISSLKAKNREELLRFLLVVPNDCTITLWAGKRSFTLKSADISHYYGERGRRGSKLPRGLQRIDNVEIDGS